MLDDINGILQQSPLKLRDWVSSQSSNKISDSATFNWLGLAEGASYNAYATLREGRNQLAHEWGWLAVYIYEELTTNGGQSESISYENSAMQIRVSLIRKLGYKMGDFLLDINLVLDWFESSLTIDFEEAFDKSLNWQELTVTEIRSLRLLKNRISILELFKNSTMFVSGKTVENWSELKKSLP